MAITDYNASDLDQLLAEGVIETSRWHTLKALEENPLEINTATTRQLLELPEMNWSLAARIISHRETTPLQRLSDLLRIAGVSPWHLNQWRRFVYVGAKPAAAQALSVDTHGWIALASLQQRIVDDHDLPPQMDSYRDPQQVLRWRTRMGTIHFRGLATHRQRASADFNSATGTLISGGNRNRVDLDTLSLFAKKHRWGDWAIGSYQAGFAEGVTFNTTGRKYPNGWSVSDHANVNHDNGRIAVDKTLFGLAWHRRLPQWQWDLFFSSQKSDLYQYDMRYGPDTFFPNPPCPETIEPFSCEVSGRRSTSFIAREDDSSLGHVFLTLEDAFEETLQGIHGAYAHKHQRAGFIAWRSRTRFLIDAPDIHFSDHARYPDRPGLHAVGFYHSLTGKNFRFSHELSTTQGKGAGYNAAAEFETASRWHWIASLRYYNRFFSNPHGSGAAAADETLGSRQTNEQGMAMEVSKNLSRWRSLSRLDIWQQPYLYTGDRWLKQSSLTHFHIEQHFQYFLQRSHLLEWSLSLRNRDMDTNGRSQSYTNGDEAGRGEKREIGFVYRNQLLSWRLTAGHRYIWQDVARFNNRFDRSQYTHATLAYNGIKGLRIKWRAAYWRHPVPYLGDYLHDRDKPQINSYLLMERDINKQYELRLRLGYLKYVDERPQQPQSYLSMYIQLAYRFN